MKVENIVEFSEGLVAQTALINGYSESDWQVLQGVQKQTISWGKEFSQMFTQALHADPNTSKVLAKVNSTDHQQAFAVWYETLASGKPGATFWPETCLIGLFHAASGVDNRHVIALVSKLETGFHQKCLESFEPTRANSLHGTSAEAKDPHAVKNILNDLVEYTVYHFNYEEGLMREHRYPEFENTWPRIRPWWPKSVNSTRNFRRGGPNSPANCLSFSGVGSTVTSEGRISVTRPT